MNKTELTENARKEHADKMAIIKELPHGKLMNYDWITTTSVSTATVDSFKEFMWVLARFGDDVELSHYTSCGKYMLNLTYKMPFKDGELDDYGDPRSYMVNFYIRTPTQDDMQEVLDKLGIECTIEEREYKPSKSIALVCSNS